MTGAGFFAYGSEAQPIENRPVFLRDASVEDWGLVASHCERRRFRAGEVVLSAGDSDRSLLIVIEGSLEAVVEHRGRRRRLSFEPAGSVVGEIGFLDGEPRSASVVAIEDGELLRLSMSAFETIASAYPRLGRTILLDLGRILARRLRVATDVATRAR